MRPTRTLRVDSKVLEKAESRGDRQRRQDYEARLKEIVESASIPETRKAELREMKKEELLRESWIMSASAGRPARICRT